MQNLERSRTSQFSVGSVISVEEGMHLRPFVL